MANRKGSFHENLNDLLSQLADRQGDDSRRLDMLRKAQDEALPVCPNFLLNETLAGRARED